MSQAMTRPAGPTASANSLVIRPAPPEVISFWDRHCQELDGYTPITIPTLVENGSDPALELFEKKMVGDEHEQFYKRQWIYEEILPRRNAAPLLNKRSKDKNGRQASASYAADGTYHTGLHEQQDSRTQ